MSKGREEKNLRNENVQWLLNIQKIFNIIYKKRKAK